MLDSKEACFSFHSNQYNRYDTCGSYTRRSAGIYGGVSFNFLGFSDFVSKSNISIPSNIGDEKQYSVQLEQSEDGDSYSLRIGPKGRATNPDYNLSWSKCEYVGESELLN